jgi:CDGSH-type Zn-finger protein
MAEPTNADTSPSSVAAPGVTVTANGPLLVSGAVPLLRRRAVRSEHGEPLTWDTTERFRAREGYALCRCGQSGRKPYCDGSHNHGFVAEDSAGDGYDERSTVLGGTGITVRDDRSICVHAGFCGNRVTNVWKQVRNTDDSTVRAEVIAMVERCPSGALTYRFDDHDVEPLFPLAISVIDDGPLWVTGEIPVTIEGSGAALETRNRVTLCRCGASGNKPLCDGSHQESGFRDPAPAPTPDA